MPEEIMRMHWESGICCEATWLHGDPEPTAVSHRLGVTKER